MAPGLVGGQGAAEYKGVDGTWIRVDLLAAALRDRLDLSSSLERLGALVVQVSYRAHSISEGVGRTNRGRPEEESPRAGPSRNRSRGYGSVSATSEPGWLRFALPACTTMYCFASCM